MSNRYRVTGPPGTGKTTYLARQVERAAHEHGTNHVLVGSFTRAAAIEIAGRGLPIPREHVGTLHALAYRELGRPPIAETKLREWNEAEPTLRLSGDGADPDEPGWESHGTGTTPADAAYAEIERLRARLRPVETWPALCRLLWSRWQAWKYACGYIDFTDMISLALERCPEPPDGAHVGIYDEAQDFTALEMALVHQWAERMDTTVLAGDPRQTLYEFRGATPATFWDPPLPPENRRVLGQSYRLPRAVHAWATRWAAQLTEDEPAEFRPRDADGRVRHDGATARYVDPILRAADEAPASSDGVAPMMVLASCGYLLGSVLHGLRERGIPYHNPYRRRRGDWNPLYGSRGVSASQRLLAYLRPAPGAWGDRARMWTGAEVKQWAEPLRATGVFRRGQKQALAALPDEPEVSVEALLGLFEDAAMRRLWESDVDWYASHVTPSRARSYQFPLTVLRHRGAQALRDEPRVVVGTVHSVKGGQAASVWLLPDVSPQGWAEWCAGGRRRDAVLRQYYVGATRARDELVLCSPATPWGVWG